MADLLHAHERSAELFTQFRRRGLDLSDHLPDSLPNLRCRQVPPAGQWRKLEFVGRHEVAPFNGLNRFIVARCLPLGLSMDFVLEGAVVPYASHRLAIDQRLGAMHALPVRDASHEIFLDGVAEDILKTLD